MASAAPPNRLRELREQHQLQLYDIASLVRRDQSQISRYETGQSEVPGAVMRVLATRYQVTVEYLMGWDRDDSAGT